jgi:hypothetical protein
MNVQIGSILIEDPALVKTVVQLIGLSAYDYSKSSFALRQAAKELERPSLSERLCEALRLTAKARQLREARRRANGPALLRSVHAPGKMRVGSVLTKLSTPGLGWVFFRRHGKVY